jgi:co-chaperonin GroES (HSP10)
MKSFWTFVVDLEKRINDTITTKSGLELYIDTRHEGSEFEYRVTEGTVVCSPIKYDTGVKTGDTLYFHHLVVLDGGQAFTGEDNHYSVIYNPDHAASNQAIAYKSQEDDKIRCLAGWCLLEAVEEEDKVKSDLIELVSLKEKLPTRGKVAYLCEEADYLNLKPGDVVGFKENRDYRIKIDGKEYYRTRAEDLMYVIEENV